MSSTSNISTNTTGSFLEESTLGKTFTHCLLLGGLYDGKPWSQLLLYPLFAQTLARAHQYSELAVIAEDGDFRIFRRLIQVYNEEMKNQIMENEDNSEEEIGKVLQQGQGIVNKYKEYESVDAFLAVHQISNTSSTTSISSTDDAATAVHEKIALPSLAVFISQFSDLYVNAAFAPTSQNVHAPAHANLSRLLSQMQQLPRLLGHLPTATNTSNSSSNNSTSAKTNQARKLHIFTACCTTLHSAATIQMLTSLFPTVAHIHPNEGTFYASIVAAEVHTIRRADVTQKITENTELYVFNGYFPSEKFNFTAHNQDQRSGKKPAAHGNFSTSTTSPALFLWPLAVPQTNNPTPSSSNNSSGAKNSSTETAATPTNVNSNTVAAGNPLSTKRLITFDRSDPEFDDDDDPDADLDL